MRRKKTDTYKFDEIRIHVRKITDFEELEDYYDTVKDVMKDSPEDMEIVSKIFDERRSELNNNGLSLVVRQQEFIDAEFEVVDDSEEQTNGEVKEVEFTDAVGNAYKKYEEKLKKLVERRKNVLNQIEDCKGKLKDLKTELDFIDNSLADIAGSGHESFVEQPTLFDVTCEDDTELESENQ